MSLLLPLHGATSPLEGAPLRNLYQRLLADSGAHARQAAEDFLRQQLQRLDDGPSPLPDDPGQLPGWVEQHCAAVARYFRNKAHALYFLRAVAPTKQVDGAWLYGTLRHWQDCRYDGLVTTYLEELGSGEAAQNHVAIYRRLLAGQGCDNDDGLLDEHFRQGAIQLALGHCAEAYMPEVAGYNLGYEQLPLHLLISAWGLAELGIDPYYFSLHVTIDNASCGHARRAVQAVRELQPLGRDARRYWQRVARGYRLNDLGLGSSAVIQAFDLERELVAMLERKRRFGQHLHGDHCRVDGRSINQWLAQPGQIPAFLEALQGQGWIKRHQDPGRSRFWQLVEGASAAMFGVFSGFEKQLLHDWITGDEGAAAARAQRARSNDRTPLPNPPDDEETQALRGELAGLGVERQLACLLPWLGPQRHFRPAGLFATRRFIELRACLR